MGRPRLFAINLSGNSVVYFAGSNVAGNVSLEISEPMKTQGISIKLSGAAYVHWTERRHTTSGGRHSSGRTETVHYSDTQIIFNDVFIQLWGNGRDSQKLAPGRYDFPFNFQLPSNLVLPTSFESHHGHVRYFLLTRIHRSWKFDHTATRAITVNEVVDINTPQLTVPLSGSNEKTLCCLFCASGPISLSVTLDRGGYCPGESIAISTEAENHSSTRITAVRASLRQTVSYYAIGKQKQESKVIQMIESPGINPNSSSNWNNELLPIPATVPSINSCRVLSLSYALIVTLDIPSAFDLHVIIPITIGNVPFKGRGPAYPQRDSYQPVRSFPTPNHQYPPPAATNPYPPPAAANPYPPVDQPGGNPQGGGFSYSAANPPVNIGLDNYTMGDTQYAPVYGFVTDYQFAPRSSNFEAVAQVKGGEN